MASVKKSIIEEIALTTGGSVALNSGVISTSPFSFVDDYTLYRVTGTQVLTSNFSITTTGTLSKNVKFTILWEANATVSAGKDVIILGKTIPQELINNVAGNNLFVAECVYDGSKFNVNIIIDASSDTYIGTGAIKSNAITTAKMALLSVTTAVLNDLSVTTGKIAALAVTTAKIADANITTAKMALLSVTTAILNDLAVTTGKISDTAVTTAKIADANVTTAKIDDGAVTAAKLDSNVKRFSFTVQIDFSSASRLGGTINIPICYNCVIDDLHGTVMDPVLSTCSSIFKDDSGTVMTGSQIDITTGHLLGNVVNSTPTANNVFSAGDVLKIEPSAAGTLAGEVLYTICGYLT
jgi:hypothetical protein